MTTCTCKLAWCPLCTGQPHLPPAPDSRLITDEMDAILQGLTQRGWGWHVKWEPHFKSVHVSFRKDGVSFFDSGKTMEEAFVSVWRKFTNLIKE